MPSIATMTDDSLHQQQRPLHQLATSSGGSNSVGVGTAPHGPQFPTPAAAIAGSALAAVWGYVQRFTSNGGGGGGGGGSLSRSISSSLFASSSSSSALGPQGRRFGIQIAIFVSILVVIVLAVAKRMIAKVIGKRANTRALQRRDRVVEISSKARRRRASDNNGSRENSNAHGNTNNSSNGGESPSSLATLMSDGDGGENGDDEDMLSRTSPADAAPKPSGAMEPWEVARDVYATVVHAAQRSLSRTSSSSGRFGAGGGTAPTTQTATTAFVGNSFETPLNPNATVGKRGSSGAERSPSSAPVGGAVVSVQGLQTNSAGGGNSSAAAPLLSCSSTASLPLVAPSPNGNSAASMIRVAFSESPAIYVKQRDVSGSPMPPSTATATTTVAAAGAAVASVVAAERALLLAAAEDDDGGDDIPLMIKEHTAEPIGAAASAAPSSSSDKPFVVEGSASPNARGVSVSSASSTIASLLVKRPLPSNLKQQCGDNSRSGSSQLRTDRRIRFSEAPTPLADPIPIGTAAAAAVAGLKDVGTSSSPVSTPTDPTAPLTTSADGSGNSNAAAAAAADDESDDDDDGIVMLRTKPVVNRFGALKGGSMGGMDSATAKPSRTRVGEGSDKRRERKAAEAAAIEEGIDPLTVAAAMKKSGGGGGGPSSSSSSTTPAGAATNTTAPTADQNGVASPTLPADANAALLSQYSNVAQLSVLRPSATTFAAFRDALVKQPSRSVMSLPDFIMLVGIPGSGKSTWSREYISKMNAIADEEQAKRAEKDRKRAEREREKEREGKEKKSKSSSSSSSSSSSKSSSSSSSSSSAIKAKRYIRVSSDVVREELMGSIDDQSQNALVWEVVLALCQAHLRAGTSVILDGTNVETDRRRKFLKRLIMGDRIRLSVAESTSVPISVAVAETAVAVACTSGITADEGRIKSGDSSPHLSPVRRMGSNLSDTFTNKNVSSSPTNTSNALGSMRALAVGGSMNGGGAMGGGAASNFANRYVSAAAAKHMAAAVAAAATATEAAGGGDVAASAPATAIGGAPADAIASFSSTVSITSFAEPLLKRAREMILNCGGNTHDIFHDPATCVDSPANSAVSTPTTTFAAAAEEGASSSASSSSSAFSHRPIDCNRLVKVLNTNKVICKRRIKDDVEGGLVRSNVPASIVDLMATQLAEAGSALQEERWISMT